MGLIVHSDPKRCDVMEQHIYCEFFRGKERDICWNSLKPEDGASPTPPASVPTSPGGPCWRTPCGGAAH